MKRRTFLRNAATTGLAAAVAPGLASSADTKAASSPTKLRAISTDRAPKPVGPFSQAIKANGFTVIPFLLLVIAWHQRMLRRPAVPAQVRAA